MNTFPLVVDPVLIPGHIQLVRARGRSRAPGDTSVNSGREWRMLSVMHTEIKATALRQAFACTLVSFDAQEIYEKSTE